MIPFKAGCNDGSIGDHSRRLWSLLDMFKHPLADFYWKLNRLWTRTRDWSEADENGRGSKILLSKEQRKELEEIADEAIGLCLTFEMTSAIHRANDLRRYATCGAPCPVLETWQELNGLLKQLQDDLLKKFFVYIAADKVRVWEEHDDKGHAHRWAKIFPDEAAEDAKAAMDCYLADLNTACVFHLMRVLEHGLSALAANVSVTITTQPWQGVIDEIEKAIRKEEAALPKGLAKNARLEFLSKAAREFFYFKEGWRNHCAHNRVKYDLDQAKSMLTHVFDFMDHLAGGLP